MNPDFLTAFGILLGARPYLHFVSLDLVHFWGQDHLPDLEKAKDDPEYEVRLEIAAAINHITQGSKAALPVWKLMAQDQ